MYLYAMLLDKGTTTTFLSVFLGTVNPKKKSNDILLSFLIIDTENTKNSLQRIQVKMS